MRAVLAGALVLLFVAGCSLTGSKAAATPSGSPLGSPLSQASGRLDAEVAMPTNFPSSVPIYPGARLTAAATFTSPGVVTWGMEWETLDSLQKVQAFYASKFGSGDWTITFTASTATAFAGTIASKSNSQVKGALGGDSSSGVTKISLYLGSPA